MKAIWVVLFITIWSCANAQDIPKGMNIIVVGGTCFDSVVAKVLDNGFFFQTKDTVTKSLTTQPKYWSGGMGGNVIINIRVKDSTAYISGLYNVNAKLGNIDLRDYTPVLSAKSKGMFRSLPFEEMNKLALSLHGIITYQKL